MEPEPRPNRLIELSTQLPPETYVSAQIEEGRLFVSVTAPKGTPVTIDINDGDTNHPEFIETTAR